MIFVTDATKMDAVRALSCVQIKTPINRSHKLNTLKNNEANVLIEEFKFLSFRGAAVDIEGLNEDQETDQVIVNNGNLADGSNVALNCLMEAQITLNIEGLVDQVLGEEELVVMALYSSAVMNDILSGSKPSNLPSKKLRLRRYRQVTRKLDEIFHVEFCEKRAAEFYEFSGSE